MAEKPVHNSDGQGANGERKHSHHHHHSKGDQFLELFRAKPEEVTQTQPLEHHHHVSREDKFLAPLRAKEEEVTKTHVEEPEEHHHHVSREDKFLAPLRAKEEEVTKTQHVSHQHHDHKSMEDKFLAPLRTKEEEVTKTQPLADDGHHHHHHEYDETKLKDLSDTEYYKDVAKKPALDKLHLYALDSMRALRPMLIGAVGVLVFVRLMLIALSVLFGRYYVTRQIEYTVAWAFIFAFVILFQPKTEDISNIKQYANRMRIITFLASIACLAKAIITLVYNWDMFKIQAMMTIYTAIEVLAWVALSIFFGAFFRYWTQQKQKISHRVNAA